MYFSARTIVVALGSILALASTASASSSYLLVDPPRCYDFPDSITFTGPAELVDYANDGISMGDFSIASSLVPQFLPIPTSDVGILDASIAAVCIITAPNSAPSCNLEVYFKFRYSPKEEKEMELQGKLFARGTGPNPYAITGGTDGLFGAFGQLDGSFNGPDSNGIVTLSNALFTFCLFRGVNPPTPAPTPAPTP